MTIWLAFCLLVILRYPSDGDGGAARIITAAGRFLPRLPWQRHNPSDQDDDHHTP